MSSDPQAADPIEPKRSDVYIRWGEPWEGVNVDLDAEGLIVGFEFLGAKSVEIDGRTVAPTPADDEAAQVERMAKAMQAHLVAKYPLGQEPWESIPRSAQDEYRILARAALAALREWRR